MDDKQAGSAKLISPKNEKSPIDSEKSIEKKPKNINNKTEIKPVMIGFYSVDKNRKYVNDFSNLNYLTNQTTFPFDLKSVGITTKKPFDPFERLQQITGFLLDRKNEAEFVKDGKVQADIVCNEDVLKGIMTLNAPYEQETWYLDAFKFGKTIFLNKRKNEGIDTYTITEKKTLTDTEYGFMLESCFQAIEPNGTPKTKVVIAEEFNIVNKATIGGFDVLYACEIDCVKSDKRIEEGNETNEPTPGSSDTVLKVEKPDCNKSEEKIEKVKQASKEAGTSLKTVIDADKVTSIGDGVKCEKVNNILEQLKGMELVEIKLTKQHIFEWMEKSYKKIMGEDGFSGKDGDSIKTGIKSYMVSWCSSAMLAGKSQFVLGLRRGKENHLVDEKAELTTNVLFSNIPTFKSNSINYLEETLKKICEDVNIALEKNKDEKINKKTHFCRFTFTSGVNSGTFSDAEICSMDEMKRKKEEKEFVKNLRLIYPTSANNSGDNVPSHVQEPTVE